MYVNYTLESTDIFVEIHQGKHVLLDMLCHRDINACDM